MQLGRKIQDVAYIMYVLSFPPQGVEIELNIRRHLGF